MTLTELERQVPALLDYTKNMPKEIHNRCTVRTHPAGSVIHHKDMELHNFGIVALGENRVVNAFENGNIYMIESNHAIDFIGEVTLLANMPRTSVTIEAVTDTVVAYISRKDAEAWFAQDMNILRLAAKHTAYKLYRSSYNNGVKLFYPPNYLLLDYLVKYVAEKEMKPNKTVLVNKTRPLLQEELGINVKTLNRTIRQLKDEDYFEISKGKIQMTYAQYGKAMEWLGRSVENGMDSFGR